MTRKKAAAPADERDDDTPDMLALEPEAEAPAAPSIEAEAPAAPSIEAEAPAAPSIEAEAPEGAVNEAGVREVLAAITDRGPAAWDVIVGTHGATRGEDGALTIYGITGGCGDDIATSLRLWGNKARRTLLGVA